MKTGFVRYLVTVTGTVQGVGFRPFVYGLAKTYDLSGSVLNAGTGLIIDIEGREADLGMFMKDLKEHPPVLSRMACCTVDELPFAGYDAFEILESIAAEEKDCLVPPDVAVCDPCRKETLSPGDRHHNYPFTNCTNCGPRFTITSEIPYDRPKTSMKPFRMCEACFGEYNDPLDRRFHAQPIACRECGPRVHVTDRTGRRLNISRNWFETCWKLLAEGNILALKGIGGFHLVCDAGNDHAIRELRMRKGRDAKPFAVMFRDLEAAGRYCFMDEKERDLLTSPEAPIVILRRKPDCGLPHTLAPNINTLGAMLPYSPLHLILFNGPFHVLVMTSGNYTDLPLVKDNEAALGELGLIADYFLFHDREIVNRCDDSLVQVVEGETQFLRRSRGYVPDPFPVPREKKAPAILGIGGEMKNNFCLLKKDQAFLSQYIGEIDNLEGERNLLESLHDFERLIGANHEIVAFDMHPAYSSGQIARRLPCSVHVPVQHHHAHLASCMADNMLENENIIGIILDGTGYGTDGCLWGFEFLTGCYTGFRRRLHLAYVPLPGGETAIREPWRTAYSFLSTFLGDDGKAYGKRLFEGKDLDTIDRMITSRFNTPLASSSGRLFDAVSALLGICSLSAYEGQAAIELGECAIDQEDDIRGYPFEIRGDLILPGRILEGVLEDRKSGLSRGTISTRFHHTVAGIVREGAIRLRAETGIRKVALSGGTWQNRLLFRYAKRMLSDSGFEVFSHHRVPANDGGIALGQAMAAHWRAKNECSPYAIEHPETGEV